MKKSLSNNKFYRKLKSIDEILVPMNEPPSRSQSCSCVFLVLTAIVVCFLGGFAVIWMGGGFIVEAVLVGETGPVTSRENWPDPLKSLAEELGETELDQTTIRVYCLCHGMDREYVWRMDAAPGLFEHIKERWGLTRIENPDWRILDGSSRLSGIATPDWWSPQQDGNTSFFVCPQELAKGKDDRFKVAFDEQRNVIFVHYWFNF
ncbi:MAG: hypothetical protein JXM70_18415 [Pirellulales bacterium]|nr:hypothetical protein [Pirellulales bacterium]